MSTAPEPSKPRRSKDRQTIQSVARASQILLAVARSTNGLTATEVAATQGLTMPTAYHLLATLEDQQLLNKESGKRYVLGIAAADIANAPGLRARANPRHLRALRGLATETRETAYLTGWFRDEIRILATIEGSQAVRVAGLEVGYTGGVHARASGKVLLAFADEARRSMILDDYDYTRFTPLTVHDRAALDAQMVEIRETEIMFDRGEYQEDVRSVSMPIRENGQVVAALAVSAPAERYQRTEPEIVAAMRTAATAAGL